MKKLADKLTVFLIQMGVIQENTYSIYQFGLQSGLEMVSCFGAGLAIAIFLEMLPEFLVIMTIFILLRTYAGGVHLEKFGSCFLCSTIVESTILVVSKIIQFPIYNAWGITVVCSISIIIFSPIDNKEKRLDKTEKRHCRIVVIRLLTVLCVIVTLLVKFNMKRDLSLITLTVIVVLTSQFIGILKDKYADSRG